MFANNLFWLPIANANILLSASSASAGPSANSVAIFSLHATNSAVKGHYVKATGKSTNGSTEATAAFTKSANHADHFYMDNQGQLHLLWFYNAGPGGLYLGATDENKDNPADQGLGTLYFATDLGYPVHCPIVSDPVGTISKFNCKLNSIYDGYANAPFS
ncbi:MAG: hypothetical protein GOMPHAMPRED_001039 [Gomphillus americanus]|uniref:Uncharacterized protein n=1 Tax=Gomphillus americanus TaxID=1940652 RepID=A0A8H3F1U7_9LECA|nr:MAG: hypothetical protein GOMPHAMPRED_001039 [Gomphillus americanus]